jgi:hypothetical protein
VFINFNHNIEPSTKTYRYTNKQKNTNMMRDEEEEPTTPVISRKHSIARRRRKRKIAVLEESDDDSSARPSQSRNENVFQSSSKDKKLESMLQQLDDEIATRLATLNTMRDQYAASIRRQLNRELLRLPSKVKKMTVKEWRETYNDDLNKLTQVHSSAGEESVDRIILQALNPNTNNSNTTPSTTTTTTNNGKTPKRSTFKPVQSTPQTKKFAVTNATPNKKKPRLDNNETPDMFNFIQGKSKEDVENMQQFLANYLKNFGV